MTPDLIERTRARAAQLVTLSEAREAMIAADAGDKFILGGLCGMMLDLAREVEEVLTVQSIATVKL